MIGETVKDFTITAQLGRGGMGDVFVAEQRIVKTKVAIKMLQPQISAEKAHVDRFFNEAIAVSKIKHAGIVKIFDVGFHQGRAYLVMECLEGETLSARLRQGVPFASAIEISRQVTSVLDATHAAGITHRDLKPDNIFLVADAELGERVRILDFGIAKLGDVKATAASMSMGTPAYMPPELWKDAATSGPATDVYALGCVVFELCCGRPPFIVTAVSDACGKHLTEIPPRIRSLRPELPTALDDLVARMLEKEQADRPTTKTIAAALASFVTAGVAASPGIAATLPAGSTPVPSGSTPAPMAPTAVGHDSGVSADAAKLEAEGRWMELVKLLAQQAETGDNVAKAAQHLRIATIYQDRFANMAEALKSYERVLVHDPDNRKAIAALLALYEKRRDWEKLLELEKGELGRTAPEKRADKAVEVARLASARVRKPDIQLYWWERVLEHEPDHRQAFTELAKLYEHGREWDQLSRLLRRQADAAPGNDDRAAALRKLAVVESDKLADPRSAIEALQQVVALDPRDKAAKQALVDLHANKPVAWASLGEGYQIRAAYDSAAPSSSTAPATPASSRDTGASRSMPMAGVTDADLGSDARASHDAGDAGGLDGASGHAGIDGASGSGSRASRDAGGGDGSASRASRDAGGGDGSASRASRDAGNREGAGTSRTGSRDSDPGAGTSRTGSRDSDSDAVGKKSPAKVIALAGVLALAGGGIFIATRGSGSKDSGTGSPGATGSQTADTGSQTVAKHGTGSQAEAGGVGSSTGGSSATGGSQAEAGGSQTGSAAQATANGLTLSYRVLSKPPGTGVDYRVVKPNEELRSDDRLVFEVMVSEQAHVFISQRTKGKAISTLFPNTGIEVTNPLPANKWTRLPTGTRSFRLNDKDVGLETVFFVASRTPPPSLAAAIANAGKPNEKAHAVEDEIVAVAMEQRSDCQGRGREIVLDGDDECKVKTRGIELDDEDKAKRVRGKTAEDIVLVPFRFEHAPPATKPVEVRIAKLETRRPGIEAALKPRLARMGECYPGGPSRPGRFSIHWTFRPDGRVDGRKITADFHSTLQDCVTKVLREIEIGLASGTDDINVTFTFTP